MPTSNKIILAELLQLIVRNWGKEAVLAELTQLGDDEFMKGAAKVRSNAGAPAREPPLRKTRSAVRQVEALNEAGNRREALFLIATKYDEKKFLPALSDIREFLAMRSGERRSVKDRSQGFSLLLEVLKEMSPGHLDDLASSDNFSGPLQLAPLSNAIKAAGEARRDKLLSDQSSTEVSQSEGLAEDHKSDKA